MQLLLLTTRQNAHQCMFLMGGALRKRQFSQIILNRGVEGFIGENILFTQLLSYIQHVKYKKNS